MTVQYLDSEQGSEEWKRARAGSLGASQIHEALARTKTGWGASRANRLATLVTERLTGQPQDTYQNAAMLHGIETEPEARVAYEFWQDVTVVQVGMARHPTIAGTHASPDGLVGDDGLVEIKCPQAAQHLATLLGEPIADKYIMQMLWQMRCCEREWSDYVSYNPAFPERMRMVVKRVQRDDKRIAEMERDVTAFLNEVNESVDRLRSKYDPPPRAAIDQHPIMAG